MRTTRITAVAAGVVILFGGLTACNDKGGDDKAGGSTGGSSSTGGGSGPAADPAKDPAAALSAAKTATDGKKTVQLDGTTKAATGTQTTKGGVDWTDGMQMNVEASQPGGKGKPMKMLYTKDAVYMNMGMSIGGKPWIKYSYDALSKQSGTGSLLKEALTTANPSQPIEWMAAAPDLKVVGKEDVRGVQATHYSGTISVDVQSKKLSPAAQEAIKKQLEKSKVKSEKLDIWIDSDNLLVKKQEHFGATTGEVYYSGYGTKVDVTPPPASQVTEQRG